MPNRTGIDSDFDPDPDFDFDFGNDLTDRDTVPRSEPQMDTDGHRSALGKICVDLCLSVVEKMDFMQPAEALPANGRGKRSMGKQARGRGMGFGQEKPGSVVAVLTRLGSEA